MWFRAVLGLVTACALGCGGDAAGGSGNGDPDPSTDASGGAGGSSGGTGGTGSSGGGGGGGGSSGKTDGGARSADGGSSDVPIAQPGAPGYFHTEGANIVDSANHVVRLTGISWFGMETNSYAPHGLWSRPMGAVLDQMKSLGFNMLRVPYSNQMFLPGSTPNSVDQNANPDLVGKTPVELLDALIAAAKQRGLRVVLDRHRPDANGQSPLWYTATVSEQTWIDDWKMLVSRYKGNDTVIGVDLHNEPHAEATWGDGNAATDWRLAAERAGAAIQAINPDLLIIVEGVEKSGGKGGWWGGNLRNAGAAPVRLPVEHRLVYSPHDYPSSVFAQTWFSDPSYPANLPAVWDEAWGYLAKNGTAPIWIGEFGTRNQTTSDQQWLASMVSYIRERGFSFAYWCVNPNSGDTGGILQDDWQKVNTDKMTTIAPALAPML